MLRTSDEKNTVILFQAKGLYDFRSEAKAELSFSKGNIIDVIEADGEWWLGQCEGKQGWVPRHYVERLPQTTQTTILFQAKGLYDFRSEAKAELSFSKGNIIDVIEADGEWWLGQCEGKQGWIPQHYVERLQQTAQTTPGTADSSATASENRQQLSKKLLEASSKLDFVEIRTALAQGADVNGATSSDGNTALTFLCKKGFDTHDRILAESSRELVLQLLDKGANPHAMDNSGKTALILLCSKGFNTASAETSRDVALQLLARGADAKAMDEGGQTALLLLCYTGFRDAERAAASREVALQLIAYGADPRAMDSGGFTALMGLCLFGFTTAECAATSRDVALQLLAYGADAKAVGGYGVTALQVLCENGFSTAGSAKTSREVVLQLLAQDANVKAVDDDGRTALTHLCSNGFSTTESSAVSREVALQLLARGTDAKVVAKNGLTALLAIAQSGQGPAAIDIAKHLILKGATLTDKKTGKTAEEHAREQGNFKLATIIANAQRGIVPQPIPNAIRITEHDSASIAHQAPPATSSEHLPAPSAPLGRATALYAYTANAADQLSVDSGKTLTVLEKFDTGWWRCQQGARIGLVPGSYLQIIKTSSTDSSAPILPPLPPKDHAPLANSSSADASTPTLHRDNSGLDALGQMTVSLTINHQELSFGRKLGGGGFGEVVQGTWRQMDVAIKRLHMKQMSAEAMADFKNEAAIMAQLRSPHTVTLFGITLSPEYTMVMECMPRGALYDVLHSDEPLPWLTRQQIALDMSFGLSFLHHERMLHRDLKSMNVLLDNHYRAKLADFGLSKIKQTSNTTTATGQSVGTVAWKAPELFKRGCKYTPACDIYSLGMTLWELASRKLPFADANDNGEISVWVLQGEQETIPTDTPDGIKTVIQACWSDQAEQRPAAGRVVELLKANAPTVPPQQPSTSPAPGYQFRSSATRGTPGRGRPGLFSPHGRAGYQMNSGALPALPDKPNGAPSHAHGYR
jgi:ankyrin repeat protein